MVDGRRTVCKNWLACDSSVLFQKVSSFKVYCYLRFPPGFIRRVHRNVLAASIVYISRRSCSMTLGNEFGNVNMTGECATFYSFAPGYNSDVSTLAEVFKRK